MNDVIDRRAFCRRVERHGGRIAESARRNRLIIRIWRVDQGKEEWRQHELCDRCFRLWSAIEAKAQMGGLIWRVQYSNCGLCLKAC